MSDHLLPELPAPHLSMPPPRARHPTLVFRLVRGGQDKAADAIPRFAGSMTFIYLHVAWFAVWVLLNSSLLGHAAVFDAFPFGLLTMVVSLEAIFLSTFVMISQNRESARTEVQATLDFETNLSAEVMVRAIALHVGVDMAHVSQLVQEEIDRTRLDLAKGSD